MRSRTCQAKISPCDTSSASQRCSEMVVAWSYGQALTSWGVLHTLFLVGFYCLSPRKLDVMVWILTTDQTAFWPGFWARFLFVRSLPISPISKSSAIRFCLLPVMPNKQLDGWFPATSLYLHSVLPIFFHAWFFKWIRYSSVSVWQVPRAIWKQTFLMTWTMGETLSWYW